MQIICTAIDSPGHTDFGGNGYIKLALHLQSRGHSITWLSSGARATHLRELGFHVITYQNLGKLKISFEVSQLIQTGKKLRDILQTQLALEAFSNELARLSPDVVILDRTLALAPLILDHEGIPFLSAGTPGGYWLRCADSGLVRLQQDPVQEYQDYSSTLINTLELQDNRIASCWTNSPLMNMHFLPQGFHGKVQPLHSEVSIRLASDLYVPTAPRNQLIGISFGNTRRANDDLLAMVDSLVKQQIPLALFTGHRGKLHRTLLEKYTQKNIAIYPWVDFREIMSDLSALIYYGGIGTLWHCINAAVPSVVIGGKINDQYHNATQTEKNKLGLFVRSEFSEKHDINHITNTITSAEWQNQIRRNIIEWNTKQTYSDTLASACKRIELMILNKAEI